MIKFKLKDEVPKKISFNIAFETTNKIINYLLVNANKEILNITSHLAKSSGKGVRTKLLLSSSIDEDGFVPKNAVFFSVAVEILHLASLVHDDIIDDSDLRRGISTVQNKYGKRQAVIAGDYLLCLALDVLSSVEYDKEKISKNYNLVKYFTKALSNICLGELRQTKNSYNFSISIFEYLKVISGKTGALFYLASYSGAIAGNSPDIEIRSIGRFGKLYGLAFQILDDCKDYTGIESRLKPDSCDLANGVITLPFILARENNTSILERTYTIFEKNQSVTPIIGMVKENGGVEASISVANRLIDKCTDILGSITNIHKKERLKKFLSEKSVVSIDKEEEDSIAKDIRMTSSS